MKLQLQYGATALLGMAIWGCNTVAPPEVLPPMVTPTPDVTPTSVVAPDMSQGEQLALAMAQDLTKIAPMLTGDNPWLDSFFTQPGLDSLLESPALQQLPAELTWVLADVLSWVGTGASVDNGQWRFRAMEAEATGDWLPESRYLAGTVQLTAGGELFINGLSFPSGDDTLSLTVRAQWPLLVGEAIELELLTLDVQDEQWRLSASAMQLGLDSLGQPVLVRAETISLNHGADLITTSDLHWQAKVVDDAHGVFVEFDCQRYQDQLMNPDNYSNSSYNQKFFGNATAVCEQSQQMMQLAHNSQWQGAHARVIDHRSDMSFLSQQLSMTFGLNNPHLEYDCFEDQFGRELCGTDYPPHFDVQHDLDVLSVGLNERITFSDPQQQLLLTLVGVLTLADETLSKSEESITNADVNAIYPEPIELDLEVGLQLADVSLGMTIANDHMVMFRGQDDSKVTLVMLESTEQSTVIGHFVYQDEVVGELLLDSDLSAKIGNQEVIITTMPAGLLELLTTGSTVTAIVNNLLEQ